MHRLTTTLCALVAILLASSALHASTTYSTSVASASSLTIPAATSGMTTRNFGVYLIDSNNVKRPTSEFSYVINPSTYSVAITFSPAFTGTVKLKGLFSADTTHAYDFRVDLDPNVEGGINVCDGCVDTSTGYARRSYAGIHYVSTKKASAVVDLSCNGNWTYVYILDNQLYFGTPNTNCISNIVNAKLAAVYGYPTGSLPLGATRVYYGAFQNVSDDRIF